MAKKQLNLKKNLTKKEHNPNELEELLKKVKTPEQEENLTRMNFQVPTKLHNAFKAKIAGQGKKMKDVFAEFMTEYIKNDNLLF